MSQATSKLNKLRKNENEKNKQLDDLNAEEHLKDLESKIQKYKTEKEVIGEKIEDCESNEDDSRRKKELTSNLEEKTKDLESAKQEQNKTQIKVDSLLTDLPGYVDGTELTADELSDHKRTLVK